MHPLHHVIPQPARLTAIEVESPDTRTFTVTMEGAVEAFDAARPGQFVMLSVFGVGEAAFTLARLPGGGGRPGEVVVTVRQIGTLTTALFGLPVGARLGVRGPFGRGFPEAHDVATLYVAGGCGLAPLAAAIDEQLRRRRDGTPVGILYGARAPETRIHKTALAAWSCAPAVRVIECVEEPSPGWRGHIGVVSGFVEEIARGIRAERAAICGPPAMLAPTAYRLRHLGVDPASIHLALERNMRCGTGECGHCYLNDRYVCRDGPVFSLAELEKLPDAFGDPADTWGNVCP